jgi:hypothetical protein
VPALGWASIEIKPALQLIFMEIFTRLQLHKETPSFFNLRNNAAKFGW